MKIAIIIEKFFPRAGGSERSTEQIARRLAIRGHAVSILCARGDAADAPPSVRVVSSGGPSPATALGLCRFARWAEAEWRTGGYDASLSVTTAVPAHVLQPRGGTVRETLARNLAMRAHPLERAGRRLLMALRPKTWAMLGLEWRTMNHPRVKRIVAISRYVAQQLFHHYTVPPRRIELIPNAAEAQPLPPEAQGRLRGQVRDSLGLAHDDMVFLFAATNPFLKGFRPLTQALSVLRQRRGEVRLIAAGHLSAATRRCAEVAGVADLVRFTGRTDRMEALYAAADATVHPTWYDPSSKVVLESLLHGVPAISTLYNGASEFILHPGGEGPVPSPFDTPPKAPPANGRQAGRVIASPADVAELAAAMEALCDPVQRACCAAAARTCRTRLNMDHHVQRLEALLEEAAGGR